MATNESTPEYKGTITEDFITLDSTGLTKGTDEDKPVKMNANDQIALPSAEDPFLGVVKVIEDDGLCNVQVKGVVRLGYTGSAPGVGYVELVADGSGGVKTPTTPGTGIYYHILRDNTTDDEVDIILG